VSISNKVSGYLSRNFFNKRSGENSSLGNFAYEIKE